MADNVTSAHDGGLEAVIERAVAKAAAALERPAPAGSRLPGFLLGVLCALATVAFLWHRFEFSLRRLSHRHRQREAARQLAQLDARELQRLLGEVDVFPPWARYPDAQRVSWLATISAQLWPFAAKYATQWIEDEVPGMLDASKPPWMRSIKLTHCSLGAAPPQPTGVKVYSEEESRRDEVILEIDFTWASQANFTFVVKPVPKAAQHAAARLPLAGPLAQALDAVSSLVALKAAVESVTLHGRLRVTLRPLMSQLPIIGAAQVSFTQLPSFSFDLTLMGGDASILPGLESWLHGLAADAVLRPLVLPEKLVIPLADVNAPTFERPRALLQVRVVEAEHVPRMDVLSNSDAFVQVSVREKQKYKTQVVENSKSPHWDEAFSLLVHYPETQVLSCRLFDYDVFNADDEIGRVELRVADLPRGHMVDDWWEVEPPHPQQPASEKYLGAAGGPLRVVGRASSALAGMLVRPWTTAEVLKPGQSRRLHHPCRLHLQLTLHEFEPEVVDAASAARTQSDASRAMERLSPATRQALRGGVLMLRVQRVEGIVKRSVLQGGWKQSVHVRAWLAGQRKKTRSVKGRGPDHSIDQELEFVLGGDDAQQPHQLGLEVWDTRWRNACRGRASVPFAQIRDARLWRGTINLQGVPKGRISLEAQWVPLLGS